jgi:putative (di)nucleoside polyphosphate hydrolase
MLAGAGCGRGVSPVSRKGTSGVVRIGGLVSASEAAGDATARAGAAAQGADAPDRQDARDREGAPDGKECREPHASLPLGRGARWHEPRQRLEALYAATHAELRFLKQRARSATTPGGAHDAWLDSASALLRQVEAAVRSRHDETAWALLLEARRALLHLLDAPERAVRAVSLREEVVKKVDGWRQTAALEQLRPTYPSAAQLAAATLELDAAYTAGHRRRRLRTIELRWLSGYLVLGLVLGVSIVWSMWEAIAEDPFDPAVVAMLSPVVGAVGATLSAMQRTVGRAPTRVPDERAAGVQSLTRPLAGAASGGVVLLFFQAGLVNELGVLPAAFASGFSERFILRFLPDGADESESSGRRDEAAVPDSGVVGADERPARYFRAGVGIVLRDHEGRVLALERRDRPGSWQLPQGGLEAHEEPADAALRELHEETGLTSDDVEFVGEYPEWLSYELPSGSTSTKTGMGQTQRWFVAHTRASSIDTAWLPRSEEFVAARWHTFPQLQQQVVAFRRGVYARLADWIEQLPVPTAVSHQGSQEPPAEDDESVGRSGTDA